MNHDDLREWLRSLDKGERKVVKSEVAKWSNKTRKVHAGGRPKVLKPCPKCGYSYGAREMAKHIPHCL
jgi:hypothetical protein